MNALSPSLLHAAAGRPVLVGLSGGLDSTVLLHLLAHALERPAGSVRAVHIHHGLQAQADAWQVHCQQLCTQWQVPLQVMRVDVARDSGEGLEAAARHARQAAFKAQLRSGEWLALGHHLDDQAETFLLRALRGSGVDGLGAMQVLRAFGESALWRPLLQVPRAALEAYAATHQLQWIEDPSNDSSDFDRNFLRLQVLPLLRERWPHANAALARSATLAAEAAALLQQQDAHLLERCSTTHGTLTIDALLQLSPPQQARLLRAWVNRQHLPPLPANGVHTIQQQLLHAADDQQAEFRWSSARIARWRGQLHVLPPLTPWPDGWQLQWDGREPVQLPDGGQLILHGAPAFEQPLTVRQRSGGERITLPNRDHSHLLKHCLQQANIPPWLRPQLPLLCDGDTVLAAGDRLLSATLQHWLQAHNAALHWQPTPAAN